MNLIFHWFSRAVVATGLRPVSKFAWKDAAQRRGYRFGVRPPSHSYGVTSGPPLEEKRVRRSETVAYRRERWFSS